MLCAAVLQVVLAARCLQEAAAHGSVTKPSPRAASAWPFCPWCVGEHLPATNPWGAVHRDAKPSSPCMGTARGAPVYERARFSLHSDIAEKAPDQYVARQMVDTTVLLNADHAGDAYWSFCPHSEDETEECFDKAGRMLTNWTDVQAYWGVSTCTAQPTVCQDLEHHKHDGQHFPQSFRLPSDLPAGKVTLRWLWVCKWTDEIFVSCIDVDVAADTAPSPTTPAPTPAPSPAPTAPLTTTPAPSPEPTAPPGPTTTAAPPSPSSTAPPTPLTTTSRQATTTQLSTTTLGTSPAPTAPPTPLTTASRQTTSVLPSTTPGASCTARYGQCGGLQWGGPTCCTRGLECKEVDAYYSYCDRRPHSGECADEWQQCGGRGWTGATCCAAGLQCDAISEWYAQCRSAAVLADVKPHRPHGFLSVAPALLQVGAHRREL